MLLVRLLTTLSVGGLGYYFGRTILLTDQWSYFEALRTTTSIVFGVMGALLAIIYPEVLKTSLRSTVERTHASSTDLHRIVDPLVYSAILLVVLVVAAPVFAWLKSLPLGKESVEYAQGVSFSFFCLLSYWQVHILLMVIRPMDFLIFNTDEAIIRARARRSIHMNGPG